jgi:membrane protein YqaA with SNARE-associated domain
MLLAWQRPAHLFLIAVVAALGSVLGSLVLYRVARSKGDAMMSRFPNDKQDRVKEKFRENEILALLVAMLGPPPLPTKLFVLVAGVVRMDWRRFAAAAFVGRLIRFLGEAYLAMKFGDRAEEILKEHYPWIAGGLAAAIVLFLLLRRFSAGREPTTLVGQARPPEGPVTDPNAVRSGGESGASRV